MRVAILETNFLTPKPLAFSTTIMNKELAEQLTDIGHDVSILIESWKGLVAQETGIKFHVFKSQLPLLRTPFILRDQTNSFMPPAVFSPDLLKQAILALRKKRADVLYSHGTPFSGLFTSLLGRATNIPTVHHVFHIPSKRWWKAGLMEGYKVPFGYAVSKFIQNGFLAILRQERLVRRGLSNLTRTIASSNYVKKNLEQTFTSRNNPIPSPSVIYPFVKRPLQLPDGRADPNTIGYFGNLWWGRGAMDVLHALKSLRSRQVNSRLLMACNNTHILTKRYFDQFIAENSLYDLINLKGVVPDVYRDFLIHVSVVALPYRESPSIKLLEAMAAGKPVVTTDVEWVSEIIKDGFNGLIMRVGEVEELADKIQFIFENPEAARELGLRARETVASKCDPGKNCRKISAILEDAVSIGPRR